MMYVARILYPVKVLGPGDRIGIWFDGCIHKCTGCSNPELWEMEEQYRIDINIIDRMLRKIAQEHIVDGFTLTGGDPFLQPDALRELIPIMKGIANDILVYTGYEYEEIKERYQDVLDEISVLVDGPYIEAQNNGCPLRGSDNQRIIYIDKLVREKYEEYLRNQNNQIQNFSSRDCIISVGIHRPGYNEEIKKRLYRKGVLTDE